MKARLTDIEFFSHCIGLPHHILKVVACPIIIKDFKCFKRSLIVVV